MNNAPIVNKVTRRIFLAGAAAVSSQLITPSFAKQRQKIDLDKFVSDCVAANKDGGQVAVNEVLARGVSDPGAMLNALGEPTKAGISVLLRSDDLTIFNAAWTPQQNLMPHNHLMWSNIGIYTGREDNIFWEEGDNGIEGKRAVTLFEGDTAMNSHDAIHSVTNPLRRFTGGVHIYGGDFFDAEVPRSQWNPENLEEESSNGDKIREMFRRENERLGLI
ncbi:MAG: hypothetical protein O2963_05075 [Proteobacteria bacterium]|jgi:predicted metal-dependent enzyme (double-stranded beta helix superfamily)|nr:hypothetical protein [Pseudomonadota bacterium]